MNLSRCVCQQYSTRFPELETLITDPLDYVDAVAILGNGPFNDAVELIKNTDNILNRSLANAFDHSTLRSVATASFRTQGRELSKQELQQYA